MSNQNSALIETQNEIKKLDPDSAVKTLYEKLAQIQDEIRKSDPRGEIKNLYHYLALLEKNSSQENENPSSWGSPEGLGYWGETLFYGAIDTIEKNANAHDEVISTSKGYRLADNVSDDQLTIINYFLNEKGYKVRRNHEDFMLDRI